MIVFFFFSNCKLLKTGPQNDFLKSQKESRYVFSYEAIWFVRKCENSNSKFQIRNSLLDPLNDCMIKSNFSAKVTNLKIHRRIKH